MQQEPFHPRLCFSLGRGEQPEGTGAGGGGRAPGKRHCYRPACIPYNTAPVQEWSKKILRKHSGERVSMYIWVWRPESPPPRPCPSPPHSAFSFSLVAFVPTSPS